MLSYRVSGRSGNPNFKGQSVQEDNFSPEDDTDKLSRNAGTKLLFYDV